MKKTYLVVACPKCRALLLARQGRKTRLCPYCGAKMNLLKTEALWVTSDLEEARSILRTKRQGRSEPVRASEYRDQFGTGFYRRGVSILGDKFVFGCGQEVL